MSLLVNSSALELKTFPDNRDLLTSVCVAVPGFSGKDDRREFENDRREFARFCESMLDKLDPWCAAGLAAPQVGRLVRVIAVRLGTEKIIMINPRIIDWTRDEVELGEEGCLSFPDFRAAGIPRFRRVTVVWNGLENLASGCKTSLNCLPFHDFEARLIQHEIDHLDGVLFLDRIPSRLNRRLAYEKYQKLLKSNRRRL